MNKSFKSIAFKELPVTSLTPHHMAQAIPIDEEDLTAIAESVARRGAIMEPLKVIADGKDQYLVVDGCNRLGSAKAIGLATVPCHIIETDDVQAVVGDCLVSRRKCSSGQRILVYLESNKRVVIEAKRYTNDLNLSRSRNQTGHVTGLEIPKEFKNFTAEAIAKHLKCSEKDVSLGIALLICLETKTVHQDGKQEGICKPMAANADYLDELANRRNAILSGAAPIRKWKAAIAGKIDPEKGKMGKLPPQYGQNAPTWTISLRNALSHWDEFTSDQKQALSEEWAKLMAVVPRDMQYAVLAGIEQWSPHDRVLAVKKLSKTLPTNAK